MCDLWPLLCSSERFSTRWFYCGGGSSAGASSWKVHNLNPRPPHGCDVTLHCFGDQDNLHVHNLNISIEQCLLFHVSVHNVSFTGTNLIRCRDICNNDNIEHKSRIITNFSTKVCINSIVLYLWSIHFYSILQPSPIYPFIPLIYHLFIFIYKICICSNLYLFALFY